MLVINIYYTGKNGSSKLFAKEMVNSGTVDNIRNENGNLGYNYFFSKDDPETVLLIDKWQDQTAIDNHHKSPYMEVIANLRQKYGLHMRVEKFSPIDDNVIGDFDKVITERTAVRKFSDKKVDDKIITKILEAGQKAPTAKNLQPQKIYVLKSKEALEKIDKTTPCRYGAPVCLLVCADKNIAWKNAEDSTYEIDASIVATHMMLQATNLKVDNIWIRNFDSEKIKSEFGLSENIEPVCLLPIGYRDLDCPQNPFHTVRKPLKDFVICI